MLSTDDAPQADLNSDLARLVRDNSSTIAAILRRHGFAHPRVFGSVARGTATPDSDIDLLVDSIDLPDLMRLIGAKHAIEDLLGVPVDLATPDLLKPDIKIAAEREAVPV